MAVPFFTSDVGLDLGTANTVVYATERGIVVNEPSLLTVGKTSGTVFSIGKDANAAWGRTPQQLKTVRPIRDGMITDLHLCDVMLKKFLRQACGSWRVGSMRAAVAIPGEITDVECGAISESLKKAGASEVILIHQALMAARGAGLDIDEPYGRMVVDIGAGITGASLLSLSQVVHSVTIPVAGDEMNSVIMEHIRQAHQVLVGEQTAEQIKIAIGSAVPLAEPITGSFKGRCLIHGIPREVELNDSEIREALQPVIDKILQTVHCVLEEAPPELSADLLETGILLTGGSAMLRGLDQKMRLHFGLPVSIDDNPLLSVTVGLANIIAKMSPSSPRLFRHPFRKLLTSSARKAHKSEAYY